MAKSKTKKSSPAKAPKKPASKPKPAKKVAAKVAAKVKAKPAKKSTSRTPAARTTPSKSAASTKNSNSNLSSVFTPLDDRVLVQVEETARKTPGGLILPDTVADSSGNIRGRVVSVGRGRRDKKGRIHPMDVGLGDHVVFSQYTGNKITLMGQDLIILHEIDVMGVVTK